MFTLSKHPLSKESNASLIASETSHFPLPPSIYCSVGLLRIESSTVREVVAKELKRSFLFNHSFSILFITSISSLFLCLRSFLLYATSFLCFFVLLYQGKVWLRHRLRIGGDSMINKKKSSAVAKEGCLNHDKKKHAIHYNNFDGLSGSCVKTMSD